MKSTKNERATAKEDEWPCLKTDGDGLVILFTEPEAGVVVANMEHHIHSLGDYSDDWNEHNFTIYHGTITLEN